MRRIKLETLENDRRAIASLEAKLASLTSDVYAAIDPLVLATPGLNEEQILSLLRDKSPELVKKFGDLLFDVELNKMCFEQLYGSKYER